MRTEVASEQAEKKATTLIFRTEEALPATGAELLKARGLNAGEFSGKAGHVRLLSGSMGSCLLVGLGKTEALTRIEFQKAVGVALRAAANQELEALLVYSAHMAELPCGDMLEELIIDANLADYRFPDYKSGDKAEDTFPRVLYIRDAEENFIRRSETVAEGVMVARDLVNTPANIATPMYFAEMARDLATEYGFSVKVFEKEAIEAMGMGAFSSVAKGSAEEPCLIVLDSDAGSAEKPVVFVGKGITFDTGGICLKPGAKMHEMKGDMAGAAAILGLFRILGQCCGKRRVIGVLPCAENMPSRQATKPGDVVTAANGKTVEILNTDAEGRLLLADALAFSERFAPEFLVDLATLTGACVMALGPLAAAIFTDDDALRERICSCGERVGERFWPMPLWTDYGEKLVSRVADLKNIAEREGGALYAALFLKNFIPEGARWAHLDIAGPAWTNENESIFQPGGTGFAVRTLWELVRKP